MTDTSTSTASPRRLLVNGESLRVDVTAPRSAGGDKYHPQTPEEARDLLLPQIRSAVEAVHGMPPALRASSHVYIEARILPNYIAASYFPDALLNQVGAVPVGSRADEALYQTRTRQEVVGTRRLVLAVADRGLDELADLVATGDRRSAKSEREAFDEIRIFDVIGFAGRDSVIRGEPETDDAIAWEAVLHPGTLVGNKLLPLDDETISKWFALVHSSGGNTYDGYVRRVGGLTFVPVRISREGAHQLTRFNPLRTLRPMPGLRPMPQTWTRSVNRLHPPADPTPVAEEPIVAVFDGGVSTHNPPVLFPRNITDLTPVAPTQDSLDHGTSVTAAVLYGLVSPGDQGPRPPLPVDSFRIIPPPGSDDLAVYWMLDQIKDTVVNGGAKIVNLSVGPDEAVEDTMEPNRWTSELDQVAWEHDVLFIVAVGNDGEMDRPTGLHRVKVPGDMVNAISVGACDAPTPERRWSRAPYSSMGPGRQGSRIQPVGVQFGGILSRPFPVVRADGSFRHALGTSLATPVMTHALADLSTRLPRVNSSVLRAFAVHFSERPRAYKRLRDEVGYGRFPLSFGDYLDCAANEAHVLYIDEITRGELIGYQVPIPVGTTKTEVRITLAYSSPIDPAQPTEYTKASLELTFRPHQHIYRFRPPRDLDEQDVLEDITSDEAEGLLKKGWLPGQEPVTSALGTAGRVPEYQLRDGGKWETLRHARVNLGEGAASEPRLEISCLSRQATGLDSTPANVPFALLITVVDKSGASDLYDRVAAQFASLRPVPTIQVRPRVRGEVRWR